MGVLLETKTCKMCGQEYSRGPKEKPSRFKVRVFCGRKCTSVYGSQRFAASIKEKQVKFKKNCKRCGVAMKQWAGETVLAYRRRSMCSRECAAIEKQERSDEVMMGTISVEEIYRRAAEIRAMRTGTSPEDRRVEYEIPLVRLG